MHTNLALTRQRCYLLAAGLRHAIRDAPALVGAGVILTILGAIVVMALFHAPTLLLFVVPLALLLTATIGLDLFITAHADKYNSLMHSRLLQDRRRTRLHRRYPKLVKPTDNPPHQHPKNIKPSHP